VNAAVSTLQRFSIESAAEESSASPFSIAGSQLPCPACGSLNPETNRFCAICGVPQQSRQTAAEGARGSQAPGQEPGQHHYHHHYHHHYFQGDPASAGQPAEVRPVAGPVTGRDSGRARVQAPGAGPSRAELAIRKLTQDWTLACNTKHLDDLVELYLVDAVLLRPNVPLIRGTASIREFFYTALDAGLGEVELESARTEVWGDVASEAGRYKMLAPTTAGKRREERGKYLLVCVRQAGEWKIASDCWSSDLSLAPGAESAAVAPRK
jgi:uncharacterized protein (TIGR02246 family)